MGNPSMKSPIRNDSSPSPHFSPNSPPPKKNKLLGTQNFSVVEENPAQEEDQLEEEIADPHLDSTIKDDVPPSLGPQGAELDPSLADKKYRIGTVSFTVKDIAFL